MFAGQNLTLNFFNNRKKIVQSADISTKRVFALSIVGNICGVEVFVC
jgi:hypothetical protein